MDVLVEDLLNRSTEALRAPHDLLYRGSEAIWAHREAGTARLKELTDYYSHHATETLWAHYEAGDARLREFLSTSYYPEGMLGSVSEHLFKRQRELAEKLKLTLTSKLKIVILLFLIFEYRGYVKTGKLFNTGSVSYIFFITSCIAYYLHRVTTAATPPLLFYKQTPWMERCLELCPRLRKTYHPTLLWAWNGHLQTIILGKMGRSFNPALPGVRRCFKAEDGATVYYDTYDPPFSKALATVIIVPGIANTSEKLYVKTFVRSCLGSSFRAVVLNHLGALKDAPLTSARIFGYGHTGDLAGLVDIVHARYPRSKLLLVGFSMGGNVAAKFLGEDEERQKWFSGATTVCQGYDIKGSSSFLYSWERLARFYNWAITNGALKSTINRHGKLLYSLFDQRTISSATCIQDIDRCVMMRMYGFNTLDEMYESWSSSKYLDKIMVPLLTLNAADDPIIAPLCADIPINLACHQEKKIHVQTQCGGHLGFYKGGIIIPDGLSWMDTTLVEWFNAVLSLSKPEDTDDSDHWYSDDVSSE